MFGGEDRRSREIVGRGMKWRCFGLACRKVYVAFPVAVARVLALSLKDASDLSTLAVMCPMPFQRKE